VVSHDARSPPIVYAVASAPGASADDEKADFKANIVVAARGEDETDEELEIEASDAEDNEEDAEEASVEERAEDKEAKANDGAEDSASSVATDSWPRHRLARGSAESEVGANELAPFAAATL
jgi:hypothetical protein